MFSKLQMWILAGCLVVTTIGFAVFAFRTSGPLREAIAADDSPVPSVPDTDQMEQTQSPAHVPLKPYPVQHSPSVITNGNEADEKIIDAVMEKLASTFKKGDWSYAVDVMYTPLLQSVGGKEKALAELNELMKQIKTENVSISWTDQKPYTYVAGGSHKYVIVPYEAEVKFQGKTIKQMNYQLGIKTRDSGWQFVNGDILTPEIYQQFFSDFPKDVEIPEVQQDWE